MIIEDWNEILLPYEVRGGDFLPSRVARFSQVLEDCRLVDLGAV